MKMTSNGRQPLNIKSWISQQPIIRSSTNFKVKLKLTIAWNEEEDEGNTVWIFQELKL